MTMQSSRSPWDVRFQTPKKWSKFETEYETPFGLMAHLMRNWPGSCQTSEQEPTVRHRRLVEMIAGYPVIVNGNRPLDIPVHHLSIDALNLSLYFDGIAIDFEREVSEYSSLRTVLLDWDLHEVNLHKMTGKQKNFFKLHTPFLHFLIHHIEQFEEIETLSEEKMSNYQREKSNFLRALHSFSTNRVDMCWPKNKFDPAGYEKMKKPFRDFLLDRHEIDDSEHEPNESKINSNTYYEHSVKFEKIQTWIQWYSAKEGVNYPLTDSIKHKLMIGASAFLEGAFAKIRSRVLSEKRPGSITIDGGGRICFISTEKDEREWIKTIIHDSLILDPDEPHPYADVIVKSLREWGELTNQIREERDNNGESEYRIWDPELSEFKRNKRLGAWYTKNLRDIASSHYPPVSYGNIHTSTVQKPTQNVAFYEDPACAFCAETNQTEQYTSPSAFLKECKDDNRGIKKQLCAFHHILYYLGNAVQVRYGSQISDALWDPSSKRKIRHAVHLDGNGIGQIFQQPYAPFSDPTFHEGEKKERAGKKISPEAQKLRDQYHNGKKEIFDTRTLPFWKKNHQVITNLKQPWSKVEGLFQQEYNMNLLKLKEVNDLLKNRRVQAYLQRKRRSFNFNALWWSAFFEGIYGKNDCHLEPFVAAGDDLILVNRTTGDESKVIETLEGFNKRLQVKYKEYECVPMSFGAGIAERSDLSVAEIIKRSHDAEVSAKYSWKRIISERDHIWLIKESVRGSFARSNSAIVDKNNPKEIVIENMIAPSVIHIWRNGEEE